MVVIEYFSKIPLHEWCSTEWVQNKDLPPWFGVLMLNTMKLFNSMIDKYCNEGWMELIEGALWHFTRTSIENDKHMNVWRT